MCVKDNKTYNLFIHHRGQLTCVRLHVLVEILFHVKVFATPLAHKLLMSYMDAHMRPQLVFVLEPLVAVLHTHTEIDSVWVDAVSASLQISARLKQSQLCNMTIITCHYGS